MYVFNGIYFLLSKPETLANRGSFGISSYTAHLQNISFKSNIYSRFYSFLAKWLWQEKNDDIKDIKSNFGSIPRHLNILKKNLQN